MRLLARTLPAIYMPFSNLKSDKLQKSNYDITEHKLSYGRRLCEVLGNLDSGGFLWMKAAHTVTVNSKRKPSKPRRKSDIVSAKGRCGGANVMVLSQRPHSLLSSNSSVHNLIGGPGPREGRHGSSSARDTPYSSHPPPLIILWPRIWAILWRVVQLIAYLGLVFVHVVCVIQPLIPSSLFVIGCRDVRFRWIENGVQPPGSWRRSRWLLGCGGRIRKVHSSLRSDRRGLLV